jgi:hypothetical protein
VVLTQEDEGRELLVTYLCTTLVTGATITCCLGCARSCFKVGVFTGRI